MTETWDYDPKSLSIFTMEEGSPVLLFQPHELCDGDQIPWDEMLAKTRIAAAGPELLEALEKIVASRASLGAHRRSLALTAIAKAKGAA